MIKTVASNSQVTFTSKPEKEVGSLILQNIAEKAALTTNARKLIIIPRNGENPIYVPLNNEVAKRLHLIG